MTDNAATRHPAGIAIAVLFLACGGWLTYFGASGGGWFQLTYILALPAVVIGTTGLIQSIPKRRRDSIGRQIREPQPPRTS